MIHNRGIHNPFVVVVVGLRLKKWWQHLVYRVDESDGALAWFCLC